MKLYISGSESGTDTSGFNQLVAHKSKYWLYSYYYLRKLKNKPEIYKFLKVDGEVLLDSGAHTLQKPGNKVDWDKYVDEYIDFINQYGEHLDHVVELDIENKVGMGRVEHWRDMIEKQTKKEPMVVWHRPRGYEYLKKMCNRYKYIGFSGFVEDKTGESEVPHQYINAFCKMAHEGGAKVHAFGYTRADLYKRPFDSADSSSWGSFRRYGLLQHFAGNKMKNYRVLRGFGDHYEEMADFMVKEWIKYQRFLDKI